MRAATGITILAVVVARLGTGPFLDGFRAVSVTSLALGALLVWLTTVASAWRWSVVADRLDCVVPMREGVPAYYRSQFLNSVLPGGVLGDVHRAVRHGRDLDDLGQGMRTVAWDRFAGQVVQNSMALAAILIFPSPLRSLDFALLALGATAVLLAALWLVLRARSAARAALLRRLAIVLSDDLRNLTRDWATVWRLVVSSVVVTGGHLAILLIALEQTGTHMSFSRAAPLGLVVLVAASIPGSIAGWGPREGVAAWAFAAAGAGAGAGVAATSLYAVLRLVSTLPGALLLVQPGGSSLRGTSKSTTPAAGG